MNRESSSFHRLIRFVGFVWMSSASISSLSAHPFHLCVGQMKWNATEKTWEVSLRLHPQDLEMAMSADLFKDQPTKRASVDDVDFPALATRYLKSHFFLRRTPLVMTKEEFSAILRAEGTGEPRIAKASDQDSSFNQDRSTLKWEGMEQEKGWLWLHFQISPPKIQTDRQKLWMVHRLLIGVVERQENTIAIDPTTTEKFSLQFRKGTEFEEMKLKKSVQ